MELEPGHFLFGFAPYILTYAQQTTHPMRGGDPKVMLISEKDAIEGARVLYPIGKIKAASAWHASGHQPISDNWRERVLEDLIRRAEDVDADAIIAVDYVVDAVARQDETGVALERICATGIAVRLANAA